MPVGGALRDAPAAGAVLVVAQQRERLQRVVAERDHRDGRRAQRARRPRPASSATRRRAPISMNGPTTAADDLHRARCGGQPRPPAPPAPPAAAATPPIHSRTVSASLCAPPTTCTSTSGFSPTISAGRRGSRPSRRAHHQTSATIAEAGERRDRLQRPERDRHADLRERKGRDREQRAVHAGEVLRARERVDRVAGNVVRAVRVRIEAVNHVEPRVRDVAEHVLREQRRSEQEQHVRGHDRDDDRARAERAAPSQHRAVGEHRDPQPRVEERPGQPAVAKRGAQRLERAQQPVAATRRWWPAPRWSRRAAHSTASADIAVKRASAARARC